MRKFGQLTVGSLVGVALALGAGGIAAAAPAPTTGATITTAPSTTVPSTAAPSTKTPAHGNVLTGSEIWWIVKSHHSISCQHAARQLQRVRAADSAAAKRMRVWQAKQTADQKSKNRNAAKRTKVSVGKVKGFQKLQTEGQALIRRINAKCSVNNSAA